MESIGTVDAKLKAKGHQVWSVAADTMVFDAIKLMAEKNVGALLVTDGGQPVGILSERDYTRKIALLGKNSKQTQVRDIITEKLITIPLHGTIKECMQLMTDYRIRHLPVLQEGQVAGIVSPGDLVNWIIKAQSATINQLQSYITGQYPS